MSRTWLRLAALQLLLLLLAGSARAQFPREAWGLRLGMLEVPEYPGLHPLAIPYYEIAVSHEVPLTMTMGLTLAATDFSTLDIPTFQDFHLVDYGFFGGVRYTPASETPTSYFGSLTFGFDVFPEPNAPDPGHVCASIPLTFGALRELSHTAQLELAATARPVWFFRQGWAFSYALTVGARFPSFE